MTNDLISREAALEALRARGRALLKLGTSFEANIASVTALECVNIVKDAPAVDAMPVKHGRWGCYEPYSNGYRCSECKLTHRSCTAYCPNCGARMDKEANL